MTDAIRDERIKVLIEAYGADPSRWPEADRGLARDLGPCARAPAIREAAALDRLLTDAAAHDQTDAPADQALMDRIMLAAGASGDSAAPAPDNTISFDREAARPHRASDPDASRHRLPAAAAALLAACLALGLFVGSLPAAQTTVASIGTLAGLDLGGTGQPGAIDEDFWVQEDEDIL